MTLARMEWDRRVKNAQLNVGKGQSQDIAKLSAKIDFLIHHWAKIKICMKIKEWNKYVLIIKNWLQATVNRNPWINKYTINISEHAKQLLVGINTK